MNFYYKNERYILWEPKYSIVKTWESELAFYTDELNFFKSLINRFFVWLIRKENILNLQHLMAEIKQSEKKNNDLLDKVRNHKLHIEHLIQNIFTHNEDQFVTEHIELEKALKDHFIDIKQLKSSLFLNTEEVISSEKLSHLLNP